MQSAIAADFAAHLDIMGTTVRNSTTGHEFRAAVVASNQDAAFSYGEQDLAESASATCFAKDCPTTGHSVIVEGRTYNVTGFQRRPGGPIARFFMELVDDPDETSAPIETVDVETLVNE